MKKILISIICIIVFGSILYRAFSLSGNIIMALLIVLFNIIIIGILIAIALLPIVFGMSLAKKDIKKDKLSKEDIFKNELMYRDILHTYSPAVLSYIDEMEFNYETAVISTLLNMELKGIIEKNEKGIIKKIEKINETQLDEIEQIVLDKIQEGKIVIEKDILEKTIINESLKQKVLEVNYNFDNLVKSKTKKLGIIYLIIFIVFFLLESIESLLVFLFLPVLLSYPIVIFVYLANYRHKCQQNPTFRTKKGNEINKKLEGLKNFIKEYSLLDTKDDEQLKIWEEYLIYSVIFKQNKIISEEYAQYL